MHVSSLMKKRRGLPRSRFPRFEDVIDLIGNG